LYSIDSWSADAEKTKSIRTARVLDKMENFYEEAKKRLSPYNERSVIIKDISENAYKQFDNKSLDFIYLDASHLFSGFSIDLVNWYEKLKYGGILAGHDFIRKHNFQICYCVNAFCMEKKQFYYLTVKDNGRIGDTRSNTYPTWFLTKTKRDKNEFAKEFPAYIKILKQQQAELNKNTHVDIFYEADKY
jgi:hypothetical protein